MSHSQKTCPYCGFAESDFKKTLRMGCSHCYEVFGPELSTFLPKMHSGTRHVGKVPRAYSDDAARLAWELDQVERLLSLGVADVETDELLDRWKQLSLQLETTSKPQTASPDNLQGHANHSHV